MSHCFLVSLKIHPDVETSKFWVFVFFTGYAVLCPGTMSSETRWRSRRPRRGESSAATFQSWDVMHVLFVSVYTVESVRSDNGVCGVSPLHVSSSCLLLFRLMDHLPHSVQQLSTHGVSTGKIDMCLLWVHSTVQEWRSLEQTRPPSDPLWSVL